MHHTFLHERLDCYRLAVEVNRWFGDAVFPAGRAHLKDQGQRASDSIVCNLPSCDDFFAQRQTQSEGTPRRGHAHGDECARQPPGAPLQILDVAFAEDDHPWIHSVPRAPVVVAILRRVAYTIMTLFRSVTQRSDSKRHAPWRQLLLDVYLTLAAASADALFGLRRHTLPPAPA